MSLRKWLAFVGVAVALAFLVIVILIPYTPAGVSAPSVIPSAIHQEKLQGKTDVELPVRLKIPRIGVDAAVEYVGLTPQGAMDVPKGPADVAWFEQGPRPGEVGSAVIAGHEGWKNGVPAVFDDLNAVRGGDEIMVEDEKGNTITFVVRKIQIYDQRGNASSVFSSSDGLAHLNLITCEGVWNAAQKSYSGRLVVFADKK